MEDYCAEEEGNWNLFTRHRPKLDATDRCWHFLRLRTFLSPPAAKLDIRSNRKSAPSLCHRPTDIDYLVRAGEHGRNTTSERLRRPPWAISPVSGRESPLCCLECLRFFAIFTAWLLYFLADLVCCLSVGLAKFLVFAPLLASFARGWSDSIDDPAAAAMGRFPWKVNPLPAPEDDEEEPTFPSSDTTIAESDNSTGVGRQYRPRRAAPPPESSSDPAFEDVPPNSPFLQLPFKFRAMIWRWIFRQETVYPTIDGVAQTSCILAIL